MKSKPTFRRSLIVEICDDAVELLSVEILNQRPSVNRVARSGDESNVFFQLARNLGLPAHVETLQDLHDFFWVIHSGSVLSSVRI